MENKTIENKTIELKEHIKNDNSLAFMYILHTTPWSVFINNNIVNLAQDKWSKNVHIKKAIEVYRSKNTEEKKTSTHLMSFINQNNIPDFINLINNLPWSREVDNVCKVAEVLWPHILNVSICVSRFKRKKTNKQIDEEIFFYNLLLQMITSNDLDTFINIINGQCFSNKIWDLCTVVPLHWISDKLDKVLKRFLSTKPIFKPE
jgi:hypothetical protein